MLLNYPALIALSYYFIELVNCKRPCEAAKRTNPDVICNEYGYYDIFPCINGNCKCVHIVNGKILKEGIKQNRVRGILQAADECQRCVYYELRSMQEANRQAMRTAIRRGRNRDNVAQVEYVSDKCDANGLYKATQCGADGCFAVDVESGDPIDRPWETKPCEEKNENNLECSKNGNFEVSQCRFKNEKDGTENRRCYCAHPRTGKIHGYVEGNNTCPRCLREMQWFWDAILDPTKQIADASHRKCDAKGYYELKQCISWPFYGCYCVNKFTGKLTSPFVSNDGKLYHNNKTEEATQLLPEDLRCNEKGRINLNSLNL